MDLRQAVCCLVDRAEKLSGNSVNIISRYLSACSNRLSNNSRKRLESPCWPAAGQPVVSPGIRQSSIAIIVSFDMASPPGQAVASLALIKSAALRASDCKVEVGLTGLEVTKTEASIIVRFSNPCTRPSFLVTLFFAQLPICAVPIR